MTRPEDPGVVLVFAPDGRNSDLIVDLLERNGIAAQGCGGGRDLDDHLRHRPGDVAAIVVTDRARPLGAEEAIARFQADEPPWSALPILLLTEGVPRSRPGWRNLVQIPQPMSGRQLLDVLGIALDGRDRQRRLATANRRLERMAFHDVLTGLPNRAALFERLAELQNDRRGRAGNFSLLFLDVDHFKSVNDRHGHAAGDELLRAIAHRVTQAVREEDLVARLAGDEFIVVLIGTESVTRARSVADRLSEDAIVSLEGVGVEIVLSLSVGVLEDIDADDDPDHIIARADRRMYEHKLTKSTSRASEAFARG